MKDRNAIVSAAFAAVALIGIVTLAFRGGSAGAWQQLAIGSLSIILIALVANSLAALWAGKPRRRAENLGAQRPDALVVQSARIGGLQTFLKDDGPIDPVLYITALVDSDGISFWRNYSPPQVWRTVKAREILSVESEMFVEAGRSRYRLRLATQNGDVLLPVLGEGLIGMMSPEANEVEAVTEWTRSVLELG